MDSMSIQYKKPRSCMALRRRPTRMTMKYMCAVGLVLVLAIAGSHGVHGAGECGKSTPDMEAMKLAPCGPAATDEKAPVPGGCCAQVKTFAQNPKCLCAVLLSDTAKTSGVNPEVAITIPKRCNFANRPVGYKCGPYTLP